MTKMERLLQKQSRLQKEVDDLKEKSKQKQEELQTLEQTILEQTMADNHLDMHDLLDIIQTKKGEHD